MLNDIKVLAISSSGGHWEQLMLLRDALDGRDAVYVTTGKGLAEKSDASPAYTISDCNRNAPVRNLKCIWQLFQIILKERPRVIISTGALPGLIGIAIGKLCGAKTIWVDSVANSETLSLSGLAAGRIVDLWITQWKDLSCETGPYYFGALV